MIARSRTGLRLVVAVAFLVALCGFFVPHTSHAATTTQTGAATSELFPEGKPYIMRLGATRAKRIARESTLLNEWRKDHPVKNVQVSSDSKDHTWTVSYQGADKKTHSQVIIDDKSGRVKEVRTGAQVAWQMARGYKGAFGRSLTRPIIWIPLFVLFLVPLIRWRRLISLHTLDLLMLCAFAASLVWFNRGEIETSVPLAYPPLVYLFLRLIGIGFWRERRSRHDESGDRPPLRLRPSLESAFPTWALVSIMLFALGLRVGLNAFDSNVIDVGYAGVIGADRIEHGQTLYGTFPNDCSQCDTYGPLTYLSYVPFEKLMPWTGTWNDLPAAHVAATVFDILALLGLLILGWRIAGPRLGVGLSLAWATYPFSAYALESNSNDSLVAAILAWGLVVAHRPIGRGMAIAFAAWAKFAPGILLLLWLRHPFPRAGSRKRWPGYLAGLVLATVLSAWPLLLDGGDGVRRFWSRTMAYQLDRESPFSIWGQHLGLQPVQRAVEVVVVLIAIVVVARPRALDLRRFAALSAALLIGLQIAMPHWFYLYIPWFLPCALVAMVPTWRVVHDVREPAPAGDQVATGEPDAGPEQLAPA
ncbi:MAG TPA: glycosyltransferase family 87 protein [Miltoncostaeales bacterium]|nr:glycosyltransferase family 87 protein [Miltoncostaeales bacterium]